MRFLSLCGVPRAGARLVYWAHGTAMERASCVCTTAALWL